MTTKQFIKRMDKLGYYVENLEPNELNIVSKNPKTYDKDGWSKELVDIDIDNPYSFCIEFPVTKAVLINVYKYIKTPLRKRQLKQAHIIQ